MEILLVSHFHWDREWYRPFEAFRARLVDAIDRVLDLLAADEGYRFLLDGQVVVIEDYLAIRPERRAEIERGVRDGRLALGPWYVQPDSLLPGGESHVRNLLIGRAAAAPFGKVSRIAYVPDSFGHPAQFPQLFRGFGLRAFVYWRGNGDEIDELGSLYRWSAPDGSAIDAHRLTDGYFDAACLPLDGAAAGRGLAAIVARRREGGSAGAPGDHLLFMNGFDHMFPDGHTGAVAAALGATTGIPVRRALLDDLPEGVGPEREVEGNRPRGGTEDGRGEYRGELVGARHANLLPGVWSARLPLKLANRRAESELLGWTEPFAALGRRLGAPDERPALGLAWRSLIANQAHDSIGGCSADAVHERMVARFDDALGLAHETTRRLLERLAGLGAARALPWSAAQEVVVFNPSPHPRTDVVRVELDAFPQMRLPLGLPEVHPLALLSADPPGYALDGAPLRVQASPDPARVAFVPGTRPVDVELVARDVPAFGCRRYRLEPAAPVREQVDDGRTIESDAVRVAVGDDGTLTLAFANLGTADGRGKGDGGDRSRAHGAWTEYPGLFAVEDTGDRGDSYDFDPVDEPGALELGEVTVRRWRHPSGLQGISVTRELLVPAALAEDRERRTRERVPLTLVTDVRIAPGVARADVAVHLENRARDHRLRLLFPTADASASARAATTFGVAQRSAARANDARWVHRAPSTFPHQGWVAAGGLVVCAPGLAEAEITPDGAIAITLVRSVGWLARYDLRSRPVPAGPAMDVEGAQVLGPVDARFALFPSAGDLDPTRARDAELGLRGVAGGDEALIAAGAPLLAVEPDELLLSAVKPAERGDGLVVRVLNPTDREISARLRVGFPIRTARLVRLDEEPLDGSLTLERESSAIAVRLDVPPHSLRTIELA